MIDRGFDTVFKEYLVDKARFKTSARGLEPEKWIGRIFDGLEEEAYRIEPRKGLLIVHERGRDEGKNRPDSGGRQGKD